MFSGKLGIIFFAACIVVVYPHAAHAYLDPGTGSYLLQLAIAGLLGAAFAIKVFWLRIKDFFARVFSRGSDSD